MRMPRWVFLLIGCFEALYVAGVFLWMVKKDRSNETQV